MTMRLPDSDAETAPDGRRLTGSAARNAAPILQVLRDHAPASGQMLELAAGSGLHSAQFSTALPGLDWQPTEVDPAHFASIVAWCATCPHPVRAPALLDATAPGWSALWPNRDAILLVNLLHLVPIPAAATVLNEIALALAPGGIAMVYGPFLQGGTTTSEGDAAFDAALRAQDPAVGYKDLGWVLNQLSGAGLVTQTLALPANNLMILGHKPA